MITIDSVRTQWQTLSIFIVVTLLAGCSAKGLTPFDKRRTINKMHNEVLEQLYLEEPSARRQVKTAPGYAVFSNAQVSMVFVSAGGGYGVARSKGQVTYMKMGEAGVGLGLGIKDFRAVFIFHTRKAYWDFLRDGLVFGADIDAALKSTDKGDQISRSIRLGDITIYQMTDTGISVNAALKGAKFWKDRDLN